MNEKNTPPIEWEYFCDESYYHQWAVRVKNDNEWSHCFHLPTKEEAHILCNLLNEYKCRNIF